MNSILDDALAYLNQAPGKQLRSKLVQASCRAVGGSTVEGSSTAVAAAIELIHSYSLIHDDLPAMDDDDMRRGQPTLHKAFDEATAILVGDGLQTRAFELIATDESLSAQQRVDLVACLAKAAGFEGMVGGQGIDIASTAKDLNLDELKHLHSLKTGALISAALTMGGIIAGADSTQAQTLKSIGDNIGLAFQIIDDVIDVRSDSATLGKTSGKDAAAGKTTYVSLMGLETAEAEANRLFESCLSALESWGEDADELRGLLAKLIRRDH
ncbi:MAG: polyprenyl synthetase family protein [Pseudomonadota bacterium]